MLVFQGCQTYRYKTTEIADYGVFRGCYDNETVKELVTAFFPEKIEDYFKNVQYSFICLLLSSEFVKIPSSL